jgi:hypothetical protein
MVDQPKSAVQHAADEAKKREADKAKHDAELKAKHDAEQKKLHEQNKSHTHPASGTPSRGGAVVGGAMTTFDSATGTPLDSRGTAEERSFSHDEIHGLAGDVGRGELGHISLDEKGTPTGSAFREIPGPDDIYADVYGNPAVVFDDIVTPSGAPITKYMNPAVALWDAGMLARNPPPEGSRPGDTPKGPVGAPVINQPVAT